MDVLGQLTPALLVLRQPDFVLWILGKEEATGRLAEARQEVIWLIRLFDERPIIEPCSGRCGGRATRCSLHQGGLRPRWWCDGCDASASTFTPGKLVIVRTYRDAVRYVNAFCGGRKQDLKVLVKELARAKGLPRRVGEAQAAAFFG